MIHSLSVTNSHIYLDEVDIIEEIKKCPQHQQINNFSPCNGGYSLYVYTVTEVMFCNISGVLTVYVEQGAVKEMVFNCYDAISIFNVPNTPREFSVYKDLILKELTDKYRQKSEENQFFNRNFDFTVTASDSNISVLIKRRSNSDAFSRTTI